MTRQKGLAKIAKKLPEEVGEGEMPPFLYVLAHPSAKPSDPERAALVAWGRSLGSGAPAGEGHRGGRD